MVSAKQRANWARFAKMARARARKGKKTRRAYTMPKKGRKGRRYGRKKGAVKHDRAVPIGASAGMVEALGELLLVRNPVYYDPVTYLKTGKFADATKSFLTNVKDLDRYKYAVIGIGVSAAPKIPGVRILAKPVDKAVRRTFKGKVSL